MTAGNPKRHQLLARVRVSTRADADLPVEDLGGVPSNSARCKTNWHQQLLNNKLFVSFSLNSNNNRNSKRLIAINRLSPQQSDEIEAITKRLWMRMWLKSFFSNFAAKEKKWKKDFVDKKVKTSKRKKVIQDEKASDSFGLFGLDVRGYIEAKWDLFWQW